MLDSNVEKFSDGAQVTAFIERMGMSKVELEPLLGISESSKGKTLRRWELYGAPPQAALLMNYIDWYGINLAKEAITGVPQFPPASA